MIMKDENISKISFICAILVIALHSYGVSDLLDGDNLVSVIGTTMISYISHGLATVAVPTFFFLSGYLLFKNVNTIEVLFEKLQKRVKTLLIPYICWNSIYFLFYVVTGSSSIRTGNVTIDFSIKGIIEAIFFHKYCYNLWFLLNLIMFVFVLSVPIFYLLKTKFVWLIWGIMLCVTFVTDVTIDVVLTESKITIFWLSHCLYWMLGVICSNKKKIYAGYKTCLIGYLIFSIAVMIVNELDIFSKLECILVLANTICFLASTEIWSSKMKAPRYNMNMILYGGAGFLQIVFLKVIFMLDSMLDLQGISLFLLYVLQITITSLLCYLIGVFIKKRVNFMYLLLAGSR